MGVNGDEREEDLVTILMLHSAVESGIHSDLIQSSMFWIRVMNEHTLYSISACLWIRHFGARQRSDSYRVQGQSLRVSNCDPATAPLESFVTSELSWPEHRIRATGYSQVATGENPSSLFPLTTWPWPLPPCTGKDKSKTEKPSCSS